MPEKITVAGVDMDAAVAEAAEKLGIDLEEKKEDKPAPPKKEKQPAPKEEAVEEVVEEEPEEAEDEEAEASEEEEPEEEEAPVPEAKSVPLARFNEVYGKMRQLERAIEILQKDKETPVPKKKEMPNFDEMSEAAKAQWLLDSVAELVDGKISAKIGPVMSKAELEAANRDVQETAKRHPDYADYGPLMIDIANRHPNLNAEEVYQLTVGLNPKKKGAVDKKNLLDRAKKAKDKVALKKKANVEKRSSAREKLSEKIEYKGVRDAGIAIAEKLGMK
jgi:hypothetical protein